MFAYMVFKRMKYLLIVSSNCFESVEAEIAISIVHTSFKGKSGHN